MERVRKFPQYDVKCPTCRDQKTYHLDGVDYKCNCREQKKLQRLYFASNIGSLYHTLSFDDFFEGQEALRGQIEDYLDDLEDNLYYGRGITFDGPLGTGKSFAAALILKESIKRGHNGYFISFDDLLNLQSQGWKEVQFNEEFYLVRNTPLLVLDELFKAPEGTPKDALLSDTLERIVRYRVSNCLPTIITTNLKPDQETQAYPRVASLLATSQVRFTIEGSDKRKNEVRTLTNARIKRGDRKPIV